MRVAFGYTLAAGLLSGLLVLIMYLADHPRFAARTFRQTVTIDVAHPNRETLTAALEALLDAEVLHVVVQELDMVRDLTVVDVRFRANASVQRPASVRAELPASAPRDEMLAIVR